MKIILFRNQGKNLLTLSFVPVVGWFALFVVTMLFVKSVDTSLKIFKLLNWLYYPFIIISGGSLIFYFFRMFRSVAIDKTVNSLSLWLKPTLISLVVGLIFLGSLALNIYTHSVYKTIDNTFLNYPYRVSEDVGYIGNVELRYDRMLQHYVMYVNLYNKPLFGDIAKTIVLRDLTYDFFVPKHLEDGSLLNPDDIASPYYRIKDCSNEVNNLSKTYQKAYKKPVNSVINESLKTGYTDFYTSIAAKIAKKADTRPGAYDVTKIERLNDYFGER